MKSTGMVRRVDDLGRVVIPKEIRATRGWEDGQPVSIFVDGDSVILKLYKPGCIFCGIIEDNMLQLRGKNICRKCREALVKNEEWERKYIEITD